MGSLYIGIILLMRIVQGICGKNSSNLLPKSLIGSTKFFMFTKLLAAAFALVLIIASNEFSKLDAPTLGISALSGIVLTASSVFSLLAMKGGTVVLSSMFSTAGLLVPCIGGIFLFDEAMSLMQWGGILLFFVSSYLLITASKTIYPHFSLKTMLLLLGTMLANGLTMLLQKIFSYYIPHGSVSMFSFLTFAIPGLMMLFFLWGSVAYQHERNEKLPRKLMIYGALSAVAVFVINQLATLASGFIPSAVLFTFINGGGTIIVACVAAILFDEKLNRKSIAGILLGVAALVVVKAF